MRPYLYPPENVLSSLRYNEIKLDKGTAERINAENFLKDHDKLSRQEIVDRFRQRSSLDQKLGDPGLHFSLNFGKEEILSNEKLTKVTGRFMDDMGWGDQPYIVYRHDDAGHTHTHVVATAVRADGTLIRQQPRDYTHYNYTSLDEYNTILREYNVVACPAGETSRLYHSGGLYYQALDSNGQQVGIPIKASEFLVKPTLKNLEQKFEQNETLREGPKERVSTAIEWALAGTTPDWAKFTANLEKEGISTVIAKDDRLFFVDHHGRSAFEGKNLGEGYVLAALRSRCVPEQPLTDELLQKQQLRLHL